MNERKGFEQAKRRARIYARRIFYMGTRSGLKDKLFFLHLPKCGGTSLSEALYATVPMQKHIGVIDAVSSRRAASILEYDQDDLLKTHEDMEGAAATFSLREKMLLAYMCAGKTLIHGHVLFSNTAWEHFGDDYKIVTMMRHPVKRAISNFRMNVATGVFEPDVDKWLESIQGRNHASVNLRYFSGASNLPPQGDVKTLLKQAHENLERIALIGFLEEIDVFQERFLKNFGAKLKLYRYNKAASDVEIVFTDKQMACLEDLCAPDIELYEAAYSRWGKNT